MIASVPDAAPVDRGLAGPGLLAHVVVSKYADHLPLNRLEEGFERQGVHIARSTMCDWVEQVADLLGPIANAMAKASLSAHRIHTDDTGIPILAPGSTHKGHVWVYVADDEYVVFRYTPRRKSDGPREFLKGYIGYVQADAANLYDRLLRRCRRGEREMPQSRSGLLGPCATAVFRRAGDRPRARARWTRFHQEALRSRPCRDEDAALAPHRRKSAAALQGPVLAGFKAWLDAEALVVLPRRPSPTPSATPAISGAPSTRFLDDARLKLDNNIAERQLRRVAVGRKNWLFAGSENGAERGCVLYSLLAATCKLHGVNPFEYLRDVIMRVGTHPWRATSSSSVPRPGSKSCRTSTLREARRRPLPDRFAVRAATRSILPRRSARRQDVVDRTDTPVRRAPLRLRGQVEGQGEPPTAEERQKTRRERAAAKAQAPTVRVDHKVPEAERRCTACGNAKLDPLGEGKKTGVWEFVPARFLRVEHVQEVLRCRCNGFDVLARVQDHPARDIDALLPGAWLAARTLAVRLRLFHPWPACERNMKETDGARGRREPAFPGLWPAVHGSASLHASWAYSPPASAAPPSRAASAPVSGPHSRRAYSHGQQ